MPAEQCVVVVDFHGVLGNDNKLMWKNLRKAIRRGKSLNIQQRVEGIASPIISPELFHDQLLQSRKKILRDPRHLALIAPCEGAIEGIHLLAKVAVNPLHLVTATPESMRDEMSETLARWTIAEDLPEADRQFRNNGRNSVIKSKTNNSLRVHATHALEDDLQVMTAYVEAGIKIFAIVGNTDHREIHNSPVVMKFWDVQGVALAAAMAGSIDGVFWQYRDELRDPKNADKVFEPELPCLGVVPPPRMRNWCVATTWFNGLKVDTDNVVRMRPLEE